MLEVVQVQTLVVLGLLCKGNEKADQENGHDKDEEGNGVLESTPDALSSRLFSVLGGILVTLLVPEVGERNDEQAENSIERVECVVHYAQSIDDAVDLFWRSPVLLATEA